MLTLPLCVDAQLITQQCCPTVIGGPVATSTLTLQSTSGVGTTDAIIFTVGNAGATESMRIIDSGRVGISQTVPLKILHVGAGSQTPALATDGLYVSNAGATAITVRDSTNSAESNWYIDGSGWILQTGTAHSIFFRVAGAVGTQMTFQNSTGFLGLVGAAPSTAIGISGQAARTVGMERNTTGAAAGNNLTVSAGGSKSGGTDLNGGTLILGPGIATGTGSGSVNIQTSSQQATTNTTDNALATRLALDGYGNITHTPAVGTATVAASFTLTGAAHTALTLSTERFDTNFNSARTVQWATGALTTQRFNLFQAPTIGFVAGSTVTDTCTLCVTGAPVSGTNATLSNTHGLLIQAGAVTAATNAFGLTVNAPTGGTTNYAGQFKGEVLLGSTAFASLGTPANGTITFCNDCDAPTLVDSTCTSAGAKTGSFAVRANGAWKCIS